MRPYIDSYDREITKYAHLIDERIGRMFDKGTLMRYAFTIANFRRMMPDLLNVDTPAGLFSKMLKLRGIALVDQNYPEMLLDVKYSGACLEEIHHPGATIYCTYHLGSYRAIIGHLAKRGKPFSLVIDHKVYIEQYEEIKQSVRSVCKYFNVTENFELINAEEFTSTLEMLRQLKRGRSLIIYLDGNTGVGGIYRQDQQLLKLKFLGQEMLVRQGIALLSQLSGAPIIPTISFRETERDLNIYFGKPIKATDNIVDQKKYCEKVTQQLYALLEEFLEQYPLQWEGWLYVHKYLDLTSIIAQATPAKPIREDGEFDNERFELFRMGKSQYYLLDKDTFVTFEISIDQYFQFKGLPHQEPSNLNPS
jgi:KDO2-lipid IV(A) lauroyltransferase